MPKNAPKLTLPAYLAHLAAGKYKDGGAARRAIGKCQWSAAHKNEARTAVDAKFGPPGVAPSKAKKTAKVAKAPEVRKAVATAPKPKGKMSKKTAKKVLAQESVKPVPSKGGKTSLHGRSIGGSSSGAFRLESIERPLPAGIAAQIQVKMATGLVERTTEFYKALNDLEAVSGARVGKEAAQAVAAEALGLVQHGIALSKGAIEEPLYDSPAVRHMLRGLEDGWGRVAPALPSAPTGQMVGMIAGQVVNGKGALSPYPSLGQKNVELVSSLMLNGFAKEPYVPTADDGDVPGVSAVLGLEHQPHLLLERAADKHGVRLGLQGGVLDGLLLHLLGGGLQEGHQAEVVDDASVVPDNGLAGPGNEEVRNPLLCGEPLLELGQHPAYLAEHTFENQLFHFVESRHVNGQCTDSA